MNFTDPIKSIAEIEKLKDFYLSREDYRNHVLIIFGLYTALRISDILKLKWGDVYDFGSKQFYQYIYITEQKTKKQSQIILNQNIINALQIYSASIGTVTYGSYIFKSRNANKPIHRSRAYEIVKSAATELNISGNIGCHSLRKTVGYQAWKSGVQPALLMQIFNHSSYETTKRYLSITQEDKDSVLINLNY